jgi:hypothetical protein
VDQRSGKYPGDDLGVTMSVVGVAAPDTYQIIVVDHEAAEVDVRRIVVFAEGEAVVGLCPIGSGQETLPCPSQLDLWCSGPRRTHWFSIAAGGNIGSDRVGVPSSHVRSSCP